MSDIVERLRNCRAVHLARLHLLMDEAAAEMETLLERLQSAGSGYTSGVSSRSDSKSASRTGSNSRQTGDDATECHSQSQKTPERERLTDSEREAVECPYVTGSVTRYCTLTPFTLTDEEREAVSVARDAYADDDGNAECEEIAAVLSRLLERVK